MLISIYSTCLIKFKYWLCNCKLISSLSPRLFLTSAIFQMVFVFHSFIFSPVLKAEEIPLLCQQAQTNEPYAQHHLKNYHNLKDGQIGWIFRSHDLKTQFGPSEEIYKKLEELATKLKSNGTQLMMVPIPVRGIVHPKMLGNIDYDYVSARSNYIKFVRQLRDINILVPPIENLFPKKHIRHLVFKRDPRWNTYGAHKIAKMAAKIIYKTQEYELLPKIEYETKIIGKTEIEGKYQNVASEICKISYPAENYHVFSTKRVTKLKPSGQEITPEVVLVGTGNSNSNHHSNFDGFLRQYLKTDVDNRAINGGDYEQAIKTYLSSPDFKMNPPKFLIWEFPSYYDLDVDNLFNELLSLVNLK